MTWRQLLGQQLSRRPYRPVQSANLSTLRKWRLGACFQALWALGMQPEARATSAASVEPNQAERRSFEVAHHSLDLRCHVCFFSLLDTRTAYAQAIERNVNKGEKGQYIRSLVVLAA